MTEIKKIGILTSGGDAPGMNSAIFGAFCATLGVVLPSFIIILIISF